MFLCSTTTLTKIWHKDLIEQDELEHGKLKGTVRIGLIRSGDGE
jgi:hypothetical protein